MSRAARQGTQRADLRGARYALHAEWTKTRTAGGTTWLLLAVVAATVAAGAAVAAATRCPAAGCGQDPAKVSLSGIDLGQAVVATLAVLAISGEYGTGMIRVTLTAMPRRATMLAVKATVLTGMVLAAGTVAVLGSVATAPGADPPMSAGLQQAHSRFPAVLLADEIHSYRRFIS